MFDISRIFLFIKKRFSKKDVVFLILLLALFFLTRLVNLDKFPIFTDEGIYIRWAKVAWHDATWRFISLTDGRQPLQTWATIPFMKLFPNNLLLAGRLFSVATGFFALTGIFSLCLYLFNKKTAYIASILYIITPSFLFYDRMALADSAVAAFSIWILFLSILLIRTLRFDVTLIFGFLAGLALLTKSSIRLFLGLSILSPILIITKKKTDRINSKKVVNFIILYILVVLIATAIYNIQRLSPFFHFVSLKNATFITTPSELLKNPFALLPHNLITVPYYIFSEMYYVVPILGLVGLYLLRRKQAGVAIYLASWLLLSYLVISAVAKVLFPRYLIFLGAILLITASYFISSLNQKKAKIITVFVIVLSAIFFDLSIIFIQSKIPFPEVDRGQYIEGASSGWGIKEIIDFARFKAQDRPVTLLSEGNFGVAGDMLEASLNDSEKNISIKGYWPLDKIQLQENQPLLTTQNVYIVFSHRTSFPADWPIKLIDKFDKPGGKSAFYLFELTK